VKKNIGEIHEEKQRGISKENSNFSKEKLEFSEENRELLRRIREIREEKQRGIINRIKEKTVGFKEKNEFFTDKNVKNNDKKEKIVDKIKKIAFFMKEAKKIQIKSKETLIREEFESFIGKAEGLGRRLNENVEDIRKNYHWIDEIRKIGKEFDEKCEEIEEKREEKTKEISEKSDKKTEEKTDEKPEEKCEKTDEKPEEKREKTEEKCEKIDEKTDEKTDEKHEETKEIPIISLEKPPISPLEKPTTFAKKKSIFPAFEAKKPKKSLIHKKQLTSIPSKNAQNSREKTNNVYKILKKSIISTEKLTFFAEDSLQKEKTSDFPQKTAFILKIAEFPDKVAEKPVFLDKTPPLEFFSFENLQNTNQNSIKPSKKDKFFDLDDELAALLEIPQKSPDFISPNPKNLLKKPLLNAPSFNVRNEKNIRNYKDFEGNKEKIRGFLMEIEGDLTGEMDCIDQLRLFMDHTEKRLDGLKQKVLFQ